MRTSHQVYPKFSQTSKMELFGKELLAFPKISISDVDWVPNKRLRSRFWNFSKLATKTLQRWHWLHCGFFTICIEKISPVHIAYVCAVICTNFCPKKKVNIFTEWRTIDAILENKIFQNVRLHPKHTLK